MTTKKDIPTHNQHDHFIKKSMAQKDVYLDFFDKYLPDELKKILARNSIKPYPTCFVNNKDKALISDMVFKAKLSGKNGYLCVIIEHQSRPDKLMPVRILEYTTQVIRHHIDSTKSKKIPLVYPIVIYQNAKPYPYSTDIRTLVDAPADLADQYFLKPFELIDLAQVPFEQLVEQASLFNLVALALKAVSANQTIDLEEILAVNVKLDPEGVHRVTEIVLKYVSQAHKKAPRDKSLWELVEALPKKFGERVMTLAERWEKQGRQANQREIVLNMLNKDCEPKFIKEITGLTLAEIKKIQKQAKNNH